MVSSKVLINGGAMEGGCGSTASSHESTGDPLPGIQESEDGAMVALDELTRHVSPSVPMEFRRLPPHLLSACNKGISTGILIFPLQYTRAVGTIKSASVGFCAKLAQLTTGYCTAEEKGRF